MRKTVANSRFAKAGVSCFYVSEVLNSSFVYPMKVSAENPRLRKAAKRYLAEQKTHQVRLLNLKNYKNEFLKKAFWDK
jgi:hypothetical protein